jgi:hypothetical protein
MEINEIVDKVHSLCKAHGTGYDAANELKISNEAVTDSVTRYIQKYAPVSWKEAFFADEDSEDREFALVLMQTMGAMFMVGVEYERNKNSVQQNEV